MNLIDRVDEFNTLDTKLHNTLSLLDRCKHEIKYAINGVNGFQYEYLSAFGNKTDSSEFHEKLNILTFELLRSIDSIVDFQDQLLAIKKEMAVLTMREVYAPPSFFENNHGIID